MLGARLGHERGGQHERDRPDRDVHEEHRAPPDRVDERAADDRPERHAQSEHRAPHADRHRALARVVEHVADDRHRHRVEHRSADRLEHAERDQQLEGGGDPAQRASRARTPRARSGTPACARSGRRSIPTASAGWPAPACRRRSPTAGPRPRRAGRCGSTGSATFTIVESRPTISRLMQQIPRITSRWRRVGAPCGRRSFAFIHRTSIVPRGSGMSQLPRLPPAGAVLERPGPSTRHPRGDPRPLCAVRQRTAGRAAQWRRIQRGQVPRTGKHAEGGHDLGVTKGLAALSLDALSSVAYGPEAMMLVLVLAGTGALHDVVPLTVVIAAMLVLLVISYTQVIAAHPGGRRLLLGREGQPGALAEPAGGCVGRGRLRAHGRGQPRGGGGQPRQRVPGPRPPPAARDPDRTR